MKNMQILFAIFLTLSIALDVSKSIFASAGYDIPGLRFLGWGCFSLSLICLAGVSDKNSHDPKFDRNEKSHIEDKD